MADMSYADRHLARWKNPHTFILRLVRGHNPKEVRLCPYGALPPQKLNSSRLARMLRAKMAANGLPTLKKIFFSILKSRVSNLSVANPVRLASSRLSTSFPASFFRMKR